MGQDEKLENKPVKKELNDQHRLVAYWAAHGWEAKEIAEELKHHGIHYKEQSVKNILKDPDVKMLVKKVQHKIYGEDPALHIRECAKRGIKVADEIMMDKKVKPHVRQEVAFKFMDRAYGKPGIEDSMVEGTVRKILQVLTDQVHEKLDLNEPKAKDDIEDAQYTELKEASKEEPKEADKIDDWINQNIK